MGEIRIKVLDDGKISVETDDLSGENHVSADQLMKMFDQMLGMPIEVKKKDKGLHHHHHGHSHQHHHH